jgi:aspartate aminotransferase
MQQTQSKTGTVSRLLSQLNESATLAMARLSRELAAQGHPIVSLSLGEPDFNTPDFIKDAAKKAIDDNITLSASEWYSGSAQGNRSEV